MKVHDTAAGVRQMIKVQRENSILDKKKSYSGLSVSFCDWGVVLTKSAQTYYSLIFFHIHMLVLQKPLQGSVSGVSPSSQRGILPDSIMERLS